MCFMIFNQKININEEIHITLTRETGFGLHGQAPWSVLHLALIENTRDHRGQALSTGHPQASENYTPLKCRPLSSMGSYKLLEKLPFRSNFVNFAAYSWSVPHF